MKYEAAVCSTMITTFLLPIIKALLIKVVVMGTSVT